MTMGERVAMRVPRGRSTTSRATCSVPSKKAEDGLSAILDWRWCMVRLWHFCGEAVGDMKLRVLDTLLFEQGQPCMWIGSSERGYLRRRDLPKLRTGSSSPYDIQTHCVDCIELARHAFVKIASGENNADPNLKDYEDTPLCVAWYADGSQEVLSSSAFFRLGREWRWRAQVLGLQAVVGPAWQGSRIEEGVYDSRSEKVFGVHGKGGGDGAAPVGLSMLAKSIARLCSKPLGQESEGTASVERATFIFVVDGQGILWLSHAAQVAVQTASRKKQVEVLSGARRANREEDMDDRTETADAVSKVADALRSMLQRAASQGMSPADAFSHFDVSGQGYVDAEGLSSGLARLGVGVTADVAQLLVEMIGLASAVAFRACDLEAFAEWLGEPGLAETRRLLRTAQGDGGAEVVLDRTIRPVLPLGSTVCGDELDLTETLDGRELMLTSASNRVEGDVNLTSAFAESGVSFWKSTFDPQQDVEQWPSTFVPTSSQENSIEPPMSPSDKWADLPPWARKSTHQALSALTKRGKRKRRRRDELTSSLEIDDDSESAPSSQLDEWVNGRCSAEIDEAEKHDGGDPIMEEQGQGEEDHISDSCESESGTSVLSTPQSTTSLHVGQGIVLTYEWIILHDSAPPPREVMLQQLDNMGMSHCSSVLNDMRPPVSPFPFVLVVFAGLFDTMPFLRQALRPLLQWNRMGRILLVGLAGQNGTSWPTSLPLTDSAQSASIAGFLKEASKRGLLLHPSSAEGAPLVLMGCSLAANAVLQAAAMLQHNSSHNSSSQGNFAFSSIQAVAAINPVPHSDRQSPDGRALRKRLSSIKRVLSQGRHHEQAFCITGTLLSEEYLRRNGRDAGLENFWKHRGDLVLPAADCAESRSRHRAKSSKACPQSLPEIESSNSILAVLSGALESGSSLSDVQSLVVPALLIRSTCDTLVPEDSWCRLRDEWKVSERASSFAQLVAAVPGGRHIALFETVPGGHDALTESGPDVLSSLSQLLLACSEQLKMNSWTPPEYIGTRASAEFREALDVLDILDSMSLERELSHGLREEEFSMPVLGDPTAAPEDPEANYRCSTAVPPPSELEMGGPSATRKGKHGQVAKARAMKHAATKEKAQRRHDINMFRRLAAENHAAATLHTERMNMQEADRESRAMRRYKLDCEKWSEQVRDATMRAAELRTNRADENARKAVEDVMRKRAEAYFERKRRHNEAQAEALKIAQMESAEVASLMGEWLGESSNKALDPTGAHELTKSMLEQTLKIRQWLLSVMRSRMEADAKYNSISTHCEKLSSSLAADKRLLRRTQLSRGPQQEQLRTRVQDLEFQLGQVQSALRQREEIRDRINTRQQNLKAALAAKGVEIDTVLYKMRRQVLFLHRYAGTLRTRKEATSMKKKELEKELDGVLVRTGTIDRESTFLASHTGRFVDTDIWQAGVMQRISTEKLKAYLIQERKELRDGENQLTEDLRAVTKELDELVRTSQDTDSCVHRIQHVMMVTKEQLSKISERSLMQEFRDLVAEEDDAAMMKVRVGEGESASNTGIEAAMPYPDEVARSPYLGGVLARRVRAKLCLEHSREEKQWVALDHLLHPEIYEQCIDPLSRDDMLLDEDYSTSLTAGDVERIVQLPPEASLALCSLRSEEEIVAHGLLATYTHGSGDEALKAKDSALVSDEPEGSLRAGCALDSLSNLILRERRLAVLRATPLASLTEREREYIEVDRIMFPRIWAPAGTSSAEVTQEETAEYDSIDNRPAFRCTMSREDCLKMIESAHDRQALTEEEGRILSLLTEFYVSEDDLRLGKERVMALSEMDKRDFSRLPAPAPVAPLHIYSDLASFTTSNSDQGMRPSHSIFIRRPKSQSIATFERQEVLFRSTAVHAFLPAIEGAMVHSFCVTIRFWGKTGLRGFRPGRISAWVTREDLVRVGVAPHNMQSLNTGDEFNQEFGRITICHEPEMPPLLPGEYLLHVEALAETGYTAEISVHACDSCEAVIDSLMQNAAEYETRAQSMNQEIKEISESVRLQERKLGVCQSLIAEADAEVERCRQGIDEECSELRDGERLELSDTSDSLSSETLTDDDSTAASGLGDEQEAWARIAVLELELTHWGRLLVCRAEEARVTQAAIQLLMDLRHERELSLSSIESELQTIKKHVPAAVAIVKGAECAAEAALTLNTSLSGETVSKWEKRGSLDQHVMQGLRTPAEDIRVVHERQGWNALNLEEQQWSIMDMKLEPNLYLWISQMEAEEADHRRRTGKRPKASLYSKLTRTNPALRPFALHADELRRIQDAPFSSLDRHEVRIRKLLAKYHDNPQKLAKDNGECSAEAFARAAACSAEAIRNKNAAVRTEEEREWVSVDKVLNPGIWALRKAESSSISAEEAAGRDRYATEAALNRSETASPSNERATWTCPFDRTALRSIWRQGAPSLAEGSDEMKVHRLLSKYSGAARAYDEWEAEMGRRPHDERPPPAVRHSTRALTAEVDQDKRARALLREIDRASHNSNPLVDSSILHATASRFPTRVFRLELEAELTALLAEQVRQRERKDKPLHPDWSSSDESEDGNTEMKRHRRLERRALRKSARSEREPDAHSMRKNLLLAAKRAKSIGETAVAELAALGPGACLACHSNPCQWRAVVDCGEAEERIKILSYEIHHVRSHPDQLLFTSIVPSSVKNGGGTTFSRADLLGELQSECDHMRLLLRLSEVDAELHAAWKELGPYMESTALHGYATMLWTNDARQALDAAHNRLVAELVSRSIVSDIMDWMHEGWLFGETEVKSGKAGSVTGAVVVKSKGKSEAQVAEEEIYLRSITLPRGQEGSAWNSTGEKVVKQGDSHDVAISENERAVRFGLFLVTVMYFRAMHLMQQQRRAKMLLISRQPFSSTEPPTGALVMHVTPTQAGFHRSKRRMQEEREEARAHASHTVLREKRERTSVACLQRVTRGWLGRRVAQKWHTHLLEQNAASALLSAASIAVQRVWRGYLGRRRAYKVRVGVSRWLQAYADEEQADYKKDYLERSAVARVKKGLMDMADEGGTSSSSSAAGNETSTMRSPMT